MHTLPIRPLKSKTNEYGDDCDYSYACLAGLLNLDSITEAKNVVRMTLGEAVAFTPYHLRDFLNKAGTPYREISAEFDYRRIGTQGTPWSNIFWYTAAQSEISLGNTLFCYMRFDRRVPPAPGFKSEDNNTHSVLINGWKKELIHETDPVKVAEGIIGHYEEQLRVSCPIRGEYWINWADLLYWHGLIAIPVKPARR
jgi:hypothetical protein